MGLCCAIGATYLLPMCYLFSFRRMPEEIRGLVKYIRELPFAPRDYVTPSGPMAIVRTGITGTPEPAFVQWGFVPGWVKEIQPGKPLVNARSETAYDKASFRNAIRRRRCLIPADGFYEWSGDVPGRKQSWFIHKPDHSLFALGGISEHWLGADGSELETAAILTTPSSLPVTAIHERSPLLVANADQERWLSNEEQVQDLLKPAPDDYWTMEKTIITRGRKPAPPPPPPAPAATDPQMDLM
jgi:putative SOS response-associated peptidase YedK